jgi:uncharacterized protein YegJ (DUF2314 family)
MRAGVRSGSAVVILLAIAGCGDGEGETVKRAGQPDMIRVKASNEKMNAAIQQARSSIKDFLDALASPKRGQGGFAVKKAFLVRGEQSEHIWLNEISFDGKQLHGKVNNEPVDVKNLKVGDPATVSPSEVSDWMFVQDGKLVGGYTIRALFDMSSPAGRRKFEKETGLKPE